MARLSERQRKSVAYLLSRGWKRAEVARSFDVGIGVIDDIARQYGATTRTNCRWTEAEKAFVRDNYAQLGPHGCKKVLNAHTTGSIQKMAAVLGVTDAKYSPRGRHAKWRVVEGGGDVKQEA